MNVGRSANKLLLLTLIVALMLSTAALSGCKDQGGNGKAKTMKATTKKEAEPEARWTVDVNDKITQNVKGLDMHYELQFNAVKAGGTDANGVYKGTAALTGKADFSKLPEMAKSIIKVKGGIDVNVTDGNVAFALGGPVDPAPLTKPKEEDPDEVEIAPLVPSGTDKSSKGSEADYSAMGTFNFNGPTSLDILAKGPQGEKGEYSDSKTDTTPLGYRIEVKGDTVTLTIDKIGTFTGTLTSVDISPLN